MPHRSRAPDRGFHHIAAAQPAKRRDQGLQGARSGSAASFSGRLAARSPDAGDGCLYRQARQSGITAFDVMQTVRKALHRDMRFDAKATTVDTSPDEAFAGRRGVCQDFATHH